MTPAASISAIRTSSAVPEAKGGGSTRWLPNGGSIGSVDVMLENVKEPDVSRRPCEYVFMSDEKVPEV